MAVTLAIPNQAPTFLSFIAISPDHFVISSLAWSDPTIDPLDAVTLSATGTGLLTLFKISPQLDGITIVQSLPTPSGVLSLHVSASKIVTGSLDGHVRTYDIHISNGRLSLQPSQEFAFFPPTTAITSIQYHPTLLSNLVCTTSLGGVHLLRIPRSQLRPVEACLRNEEGLMPSHHPHPAWATAWTPLPGPGREVSTSGGQGLYTVGDDGYVRNISWTTSQDFLTNKERNCDEPPRNVHGGMGITGIANLMVPGRMEGRDIVVTSGRDGTVKIVDLFTNGGQRGGALSTLQVNDSRGTRGVKLFKQPHVPDEDLEDRILRNELEDIELARQIEVGEADIDTDDDEMEMEEEEKENFHQDGDDDEPFDADDFGESISSGPWIKPRNYTFVVGCLGVGPTLVAAQCSQGQETEGWDGRSWDMRKIAVFGNHSDEKALVFDAYLHEGRMIGVSASLSISNGIPAAKVCMWESQ
ncbi:hypothetical protein HYALB_00004841 [Hymenoscyphus albidus]|uniref:WD40 repeat-like protein n=1 Tax=Hymenoscyphus albidus TaxID=595503 RepID=A0A9N9Q6T0_9HELO|nr:hypothetical protein HYALB_00004841 [Hymenoscyphus albidus]